MKKLSFYFLFLLIASTFGFAKSAYGTIGYTSGYNVWDDFAWHNTGITMASTAFLVTDVTLYWSTSNPPTEAWYVYFSGNYFVNIISSGNAGQQFSGNYNLPDFYVTGSGTYLFETKNNETGSQSGNNLLTISDIYINGYYYVTADAPTISGNGQTVCPGTTANVSVNNPDPDGGVYWSHDGSNATNRNLLPGTYYVRNNSGLSGLESGWTTVYVYVFVAPSVDNGNTASSTWCNGNATLTGNVTNTGGTVTSWSSGFRYGTDPALNTYIDVPSGSTGYMSQGISGLVGGTTIYYRTYAGNCAGLTLGSIQSFVAVNTPDMTATTPAYVHQLADADYHATDYRYVLLEGNVTHIRGENVNARGFYYSINSVNNSPNLGGTGVTTITHSNGGEYAYPAGTFTVDLGNVPSALQRGTYYAFTSWATHTNCYDHGISSVQHFWTLAEATMDTPNSDTEILHNSIKYTASFENTGASTVTEYGVVYARREKIDPSHNGTAAYFPIIGGTDCIKISFWNGSTANTNGSTEKIIGGDNFVSRDFTDANVNNPFLYSNTTYYLRPYVKNNAGTFYGVTQTILTDDAPSQIEGQIASISLNNESSSGDWSDNNNSNSDATPYGAPTTNSPDSQLSTNLSYAGDSNDSWRSWVFDGNDYFTLPYNSNSGRLNNNSAKALFIYFRTQGTPISNRQVLLELGGSTSGLNSYIYNNKLWVGIWNSTQRRYFSKTISTNTNYLLNIEFNGTKARTAINGECSSSMLFSGFASNSNLNGIGASSNGTRYMDLTRGSGAYDYYTGKIADVLMYNDCSQSLRTTVMNYFDQKYGNTFRNNYTAYFGKAALEANWDEYELEVSPFDNNDNIPNNNFEVYKSQKELMINLNLDESEQIELAIFDMNGIKVGTISNNELKKGINNFNYSTENLISGVYIVRAIGLNVNHSVKVNLLK